MSTTNEFFLWFYYGLGGLGGWFVFLLLALVSVIWLLYDSGSRRLPAIGWRIAVIMTAAFLLPAILYRFTVTDLESMKNSPLTPFSEPIFYLGVLGGLLPIVCLIGYTVSYHGLVGCPNGHAPYEAALGRCPECERLQAPPAPAVMRPVHVSPPQAASPQYTPTYDIPVTSPSASKSKVQAWLVGPDGTSHQLCQDETTIGRSSQNDIHLSGDSTVGRQHAKIIEKEGRFRLIDLGTKNHTRLNGHIIREPELLEADDEIRFGDETVLHFVTTRG
jgi:hypothetical protein